MNLFVDHLKKLFPKQKDYEMVLSYLAACVQYAGKVKFQFCLLVHGPAGLGKSLLASAIAESLEPQRSYSLGPTEVGNPFNSWVVGKYFIHVEEDVDLDELKALLTGDKIKVHQKGVESKLVPLTANFLWTSNEPNIKATNSRRAVLIKASSNSEFVEPYFAQYHKWWRKGGQADTAAFLRSYPIVDKMNPALAHDSLICGV